MLNSPRPLFSTELCRECAKHSTLHQAIPSRKTQMMHMANLPSVFRPQSPWLMSMSLTCDLSVVWRRAVPKLCRISAGLGEQAAEGQWEESSDQVRLKSMDPGQSLFHPQGTQRSTNALYIEGKCLSIIYLNHTLFKP